MSVCVCVCVVHVCVCACVHVHMRVCVCVCEREREREKERKSHGIHTSQQGNGSKRELNHSPLHWLLSVRMKLSRQAQDATVPLGRHSSLQSP